MKQGVPFSGLRRLASLLETLIAEILQRFRMKMPILRGWVNQIASNAQLRLRARRKWLQELQFRAQVLRNQGMSNSYRPKQISLNQAYDQNLRFNSAKDAKIDNFGKWRSI
jgi:hypothetical protein